MFYIGRNLEMFDRYKDVLTHLSEYSHNVFRKGYFSWLLNQCRGWGTFSYALLTFNFVLQVISLIQSISQAPLQSIIAFIGGNLSVARHRDFQPFGDSGLGRRNFCNLHRNHRIHGRKFRNCLGTNRLSVVS